MHVGFPDLPDGTTQAVRTVNNDHYITYTRELDFTRFNKPVPAGNITREGAKVIKEKYDAGLAEFSAHFHVDTGTVLAP